MSDLITRYCQRCGKDLGPQHRYRRTCQGCRYACGRNGPYRRGTPPVLTAELAQAGFHRLTNPFQFRAFVAGHTIDYWPNRQRWKFDFGVPRHGTDADVLAFMRSCLHEDIPAPYRRHLQPTRTRAPV